MSDASFTERNVIDLNLCELPFGENQSKIHLHDPSRVRIKLQQRKYPKDIGAWAYTKRKRKGDKGNADGSVFLVDYSTLRKDRLIALSNLFESMFTAYHTGQLTEISVDGLITGGNSFIDWCDGNEFTNVFENTNSSRIALRAYIQHLEERIKLGTIHINSAASYQNKAIRILGWCFNQDCDELTAGIRKICINVSATNSTNPPESHTAGKALALCGSLFSGLGDFILKNCTYPHLVQLPNESVWIFPSTKWMATKSELERRSQWKHGRWAWNYESGSINQPRDIYFYYHNKTKNGQLAVARQQIRQARMCLDNANRNPRYLARLKLASWAHDAFIVLFFANTGMNMAQALSLKWSDEFEVSSEYQGFRSIKYRANNKAVEFYISTAFLPQFKAFLKLRDYMLNGDGYPYLFVSLGKKSQNPPARMTEKILHQFFERLRNIDAELPTITSREWRSFKSDFLIRNTDIATTSLILQNSPITTLRAYAEGSESVSADEMTGFFSHLKQHIFNTEIPTHHLPTATGHCSSDMSDPESEDKSSPIKPNCRQPEGCLFCKHYAIHTEDQDIRKLLSLAFIIKETAPLSQSISYHDQVFGIVLNRIEEILNAVSLLSEDKANMVSNIRKDVIDNENLDDYWERKLSMLCDIGAL